MKKVDKLVLESFIGPFIITFLVVVFILLNINMIKYFDDIVGKGLDWAVIGRLFFYFAIFTIPTAMPLAVLLSSLIAFGNLGEHFELTAIKSAGISLVRVLRPIFFFVLLLTGVAFWANNNLVPKAALEAYSLLYDIKQKKPALELQEGMFYDGIPGISIKIDKKFPDGQTFNNVVIYDHRKNDGNKEVTVADSGKMYTILNEHYMKLELFNGYNYTEGASNEREITGQRGSNESLTRSEFTKTQIVFDMSSFQLGNTEKKWFQGNRIMRNLTELNSDIDSLRGRMMEERLKFYQNRESYFSYFTKRDSVYYPDDVVRYRKERDRINQSKYNPLNNIDTANAQAAIPVNTDSVDKKSTPDTTQTNSVVAQKTDEVPADRDQNYYQKKYNSAKTASVVAKDSVVAKADEAKSPRPAKKRERARQKERIRPTALSKSGRQKAFKPDVDVVSNLAESDNKKPALSDSAITAKIDELYDSAATHLVIQNATNMARQVKSQITTINAQSGSYNNELRIYVIQWHKILASSLACIAMFLIGAPLGAIIKRGGLGMPFLVSILFFIVYYVLTMQGEKLARQDVNIPTGIYAADFILFLAGLIFLRQARIDARLFETDFYSVLLDRFKKWRKSRSEIAARPV
jgi:lipopolysaccharide export system permease protein